MPIVDVPVSNLDSVSDLMDWLATELVTNYGFTERRRFGTVLGDDLKVVLTRPNSETFHQDYEEFALILDGTSTESATNNQFSFNISWRTYENLYETTTPASVTVDFNTTSPTDQYIDITAGDFTNWTTAGYTGGQFLRITNAATPANDGLYEISSISNGTSTGSRLNIREISNGGIKDIDTADTGDVITVVEEKSTETGDNTGWIQGSYSGIAWNCGINGMPAAAPYTSARLITSIDADTASPAVPLQFILVIQTDLEVFSTISFGEVVKIVPFVGGLYATGNDAPSVVDGTIGLDGSTQQFPFQGVGSSAYNENLNSNSNPGGIYVSDWNSIDDTTLADAFGWQLFGSGGTGPFSNAPEVWTAAIFPYYKGNGYDLIGLSPSAFSGQSERWPVMIFCGQASNRDYNVVRSEHSPAAIIPDVFIADITNVDANSVFDDDFSERFLVVPFYTKTGAGDGSTEKYGLLIRNPDLILT